MDHLLCVQLAHPGKEHSPRGYGTKWNIREDDQGRFVSHARKFMKVHGRYHDGRLLHQGDICLWGEWEPQSNILEVIKEPLPHGPRYLYEPYFTPPISYDKLQNTDPFVFGPNFHYGFCRQPNSRTLRSLDQGSVVMFGSSRRNAQGTFDFMLDTLIVVDHWLEHTMEAYEQDLQGQVVDEYMDVTVRAWYADKKVHGTKYRLYFGATPSNTVNGMFSFSPCLPFVEGSRGFARPTISIPRVMAKGLLQMFKFTSMTNLDEMKSIWNMIVQQVLNQGLMLGVGVDMPLRAKEKSTESV